MSEQEQPKPNQMISTPPSRISAPVGAGLSIIPGLGQLVTGYVWRGVLIGLAIVSIFGLSLWRLDDAKIKFSIFPPSIDTVDLSRPQEEALTYALVAMFFGLIAYLWNIYDGYACASGKSSPPRLGIVFIILGTLTVGAHITEINVGKAVREVDDIVPRLSQILWPWNPDKILTYDTETTEGTAAFLASNSAGIACAMGPATQPEVEDGQPYLLVDPDCGQPSGQFSPSGIRTEGTAVSVQGFNFIPNDTAELVIKPESVPAFRPRVDAQVITVTPDENGDFEFEFNMPNFTIPAEATGPIEVEIIVRQTRNVGAPYLVEEFWLALEGIVITLFLALMATAAGLVLAVPMSFLAARNLMSTNPITYGIYYVVRLVMNVVRSIEPIIWALIAIVWVGPGPFAGVIALTIHTIAALGKLYSESIESIDDGPIEAIQATGANRLQTIIYAVVPQVIPPFVSFTIYRWDINVRMSTIIGAVGGGGIGVVLIQWIRLADYDSVGIAVWMIAIVVTILDYASSQIREAYT